MRVLVVSLVVKGLYDSQSQMWLNETFRSGLFGLSELAVVTFTHSPC